MLDRERDLERDSSFPCFCSSSLAKRFSILSSVLVSLSELALLSTALTEGFCDLIFSQMLSITGKNMVGP